MWPIVSVKDVCESVIDCVNKTAPVVNYETPYKMIRTTNVKKGVVSLVGARFVEKSTFEKWTRRTIPRVGDVILTREAPLGDVGMITTPNQNIFLGQRLMQYRVNPAKLNAHYLLYALQGSDLQGQLKAAGSGSTVEHIRVGDAENLKIKLPSIEIQKSIGQLLANYDNLIENNNRRIAILEDMAQSLYREWFVNFRYPGHADDVDKDGNQKLIDSPLGQIPEGWDVKPLGELVNFKRKTIKKGDVAEQTPYMGLEHFPRKSIALSEWEEVSKIGSNKLAFTRGDILFGKIRPNFHKVGVAQVDGLCSSDTFVFSPKDVLHHALIAMLTFSNEFVAQAVQTSQGSKMPRASWDVLKEFSVCIPDRYIIERFNTIVNPAIEQVRVLSLKNRNLKQQRDMMLPKLISGRIELKD